MQIVIDWSAWDCKNPKNGMEREVIEVEDGFIAWEEGVSRAEDYILGLFPDAVFGRVDADEQTDEYEDDDTYILAYEDDDLSTPIATIY